jgi:hypothetical protein
VNDRITNIVKSEVEHVPAASGDLNAVLARGERRRRARRVSGISTAILTGVIAIAGAGLLRPQPAHLAGPGPTGATSIATTVSVTTTHASATTTTHALTQLPNGPISTKLAAALDAIPELGVVPVTRVEDLGEGSHLTAGSVLLRDDDGSQVDVTVQRPADTVHIEPIGPVIETSTGPNGEELVVRTSRQEMSSDYEAAALDSIQVDGTDETGLSVTMTVVGVEQRDPTLGTSPLLSITVDQVKRWVVDLLETAAAEGWTP